MSRQDIGAALKARRSNAWLALMVWAGLTSSAAASDPAAVLGVWRVASGDAQVEIAACGASVCGRLLEVDAPPGQTDERNPDPALRSRPLVGLTMLEGFRRAEAGWVDGAVYDPKTGRSYRAELSPRPDGRLAMKGCVRGTPLCRTELWTRAR